MNGEELAGMHIYKDDHNRYVITSSLHYIWKRFFRLAKQEYKLAIILYKLTTFCAPRCFFINAEL